MSSPRILPHLRFNVGLYLHFAKNPVVVFAGDGTPLLSPLENQTAVDVLFSVGLLDRIELGLAVPLSLAESGQDLALIGGVGAVSGTHPGDLRLQLKASLLGAPTQTEGVFLSAAASLGLPTGAGEQLVGASGVTGSVGLLGELRRDKLSLQANLSPSFAKTVTIQNLTIGNFVRLAAGLSYQATAKVALLTEVDSRFSLLKENAAHIPTEARAGVKLSINENVSIPMGAGVGLNNGFGAPDFRLFAGMNFQPQDPDSDNDGIKRAEDKCPAEAEDKDDFEDADGCPELDNDQDKIADTDDKCQNEAEDKDGFKDEDGCPELDNDEDGVADLDDKCQNEAEDKDNFEDADGCPELDNDQDSIADTDDKCPLEAGAAGLAGCPDADGDKIADNKDACPKEAEDFDNIKDEDGCPDADDDDDGVADANDLCKSEREDGLGAAPRDGCKENAAILIGKTVVISDKIFFDTERASIKKVSFPLLDSVVKVLQENPQIKIVIEGHTDDVAAEKKNQKLSEQRAESVKKYLVKKGVDATRLDTKGYGESKPLAPIEGLSKRELDDARDKNRRVEFVVVQ